MKFRSSVNYNFYRLRNSFVDVRRFYLTLFAMLACLIVKKTDGSRCKIKIMWNWCQMKLVRFGSALVNLTRTKFDAKRVQKKLYDNDNNKCVQWIFETKKTLFFRMKMWKLSDLAIIRCSLLTDFMRLCLVFVSFLFYFRLVSDLLINSQREEVKFPIWKIYTHRISKRIKSKVRSYVSFSSNFSSSGKYTEEQL